MALANVIIAGIGRSGTTSMFRYLCDHPDVCGSLRKETNYFEYPLYGVDAPPLSEYAANFSRHRGEAVILEASPSYFSEGKAVAEEIRRVLGKECKIVVTLREPKSRLVSFYTHALSRMIIEPDLSLDDYVLRCRQAPSIRESRSESSHILDGYYGGFYSDPLAEWSEVFGEKLKVVFYENLDQGQERFMVELADWIGIDSGFYEGRDLATENASHAFRRPRLHQIANWFNDQMEPIMNRHPTVGSYLRKTYLRINTDRPDAVEPSAELNAFLEEQYGRSNQAVANLLSKRGYADLPQWLETPALD